jgi:ribonucleoside-diphosphate reductase alpha chain
VKFLPKWGKPVVRLLTNRSGRTIGISGFAVRCKGDAIVKQLIGIRCPSPSWQNGKIVLSCPDAMAQVLKNITGINISESGDVMTGVCPECSNIMVHEEGCKVCHACGFSKCS